MRFTLLFLSILFPVSIFAQSGMLDSQSTLAQMNLLVAQYESRIKQLEAENAVLRLEMIKANVKIPLVDYSGAIAKPIPTTLSGQVLSPSVIVGSGVESSGSVLSSSGNATLTQISTQYGVGPAGFISRVNKDWSAIRSAYSLPISARLAGYEFVQTGAQDFVFADIIVSTGAKVGVYDMKILYQFEKSEFKRKLIGIFDYSSATERYATRTGSNPFGGVARLFIADPYYVGTIGVPSTAVISTSGSSSIPTSPSVVNSGSVSPTTPVTMADISKAYSEKRYLTTISLSSMYLASNTPTSEILSIRYRTYFIIGKYAESLAELAKMEALGALDRQTACNAQVIATYSKNQSLVDKYTALCKK